MNKSHRVIWSCVRNCFVVASEKTKANGKAASTKKAVALAVASLFLAPGLASATGCVGADPISSFFSTTQCYLDSADITVNHGGNVIVTGGDAIYAAASDYTGVLLNGGVLSSTDSGSLVDIGTGSVTTYSVPVYVAGVNSDGALSGSLTNGLTGSISAQITSSLTQADVTSDTYAYAYAYSGNWGESRAAAVSVAGDVNGLISNAGAISALANASVVANATTTSINSDADAHAYAYAYTGNIIASGVQIGGNLNGHFLNDSTGIISASASETSTSNAVIDHDGYTGAYAAAYSTAKSHAIAYGVNVSGGMGEGATFINRGMITAGATSTVTSTATIGADYAYAYAYAGARAYATAYGLNVRGTVAAGASIDNYGSIVVTSDASSTTTANSAAINLADAQARNNAYANAYGVNLNHGINGGMFTNHNVISATATGDAVSTATGNSADVRATSYGSGQAGALITGNYYDGFYNIAVDGTVKNAGVMTATAIGTGSAVASSASTYNDAYAYANANARANADAYGMYLNGYLAADASVVNSGTITVSADTTVNQGSASASVSGDYAHAYAYGSGRSWSDADGIYSRGLLAGASIVNRGTITSTAASDVTATSTANADSALSSAYAYTETNAYSNAYGILVGHGGLAENATINNSGAINVIATANSTSTATATGEFATADAYAYAYAYATGIHVHNSLATGASIVNTGVITAEATSTATATAANSTGAYTYARAYGVQVTGSLDAGATFLNTGTISAIANATNAEAYGVKIDNELNGVLTNTGTISGATSLDPSSGYSLYVNDGTTGIVDNKLGGLLDGNLYIGGTVAVSNAGAIHLTGNSEAYIGGDYTQTGTGVLKIDAASNSNYSNLTVAGTANLAGTVDVNVNNINTLAVGQTLSAVVSAGTLSGNFTRVTDNSILFSFESLVNANDIDLAVVKQETVTQTANITGNNPALGAAGVLDAIIDQTIPSNPTMDTVITALGKMGTAQEVSNAVSQTLPIMTGALSQSTRNSMHGVNRIIQSRQEGQHGRSSGDEFFGNKNAWFKPFGSWANQSNNNGASGYDATSYGMIFGADADISDSDKLGVAFAYARSSVDGNSSVAPQHAHVDTYQLALYSSHELGDNTDVSFQADFGTHNNEGRRRVVFLNQTATSDYSSWSAHLGAGLAHTMQLTELTSFTPSVRADYTYMHDDSYSEKGSAVNLNVSSNGVEELVFSVDGKLAHKLTDKATITANLGLGYDVLNEQASITSAFAAVPTASFTTKGIDPSSWLARGGLGLVGKVTESLELSARYDFEVRDNYDNQTASVKARWSF
ncbi:MAG: autotransporter domain-containing protein [Pseudomonadota bacterium]